MLTTPVGVDDRGRSRTRVQYRGGRRGWARSRYQGKSDLLAQLSQGAICSLGVALGHNVEARRAGLLRRDELVGFDIDQRTAFRIP